MTNFAVPVPEAGENAIATFNVAGLRKLQEKFGEGYAPKILTAFDGGNIEAIAEVAEIAIQGGSATDAMERLSVSDLTARLADALMLRLRGKTVAELEDDIVGA